MTQNKNQKSSLFVLGAGVSVDHLYPTGQDLLNDIVNILDEKIPIFDGLFEIRSNLKNKSVLAILLSLKTSVTTEILKEDEYKEYLSLIDIFHTHLKYSTPRSIDDFIDSHTKNESDKTKKKKISNIGKFLIVLRLIHYERKSLEYNLCLDDEKKLVYKQKRTFFTELWQQLYGASSYDDFILNIKKISFITFNYDRLLESFLYESAKHFFAIDEQRLQEDLREYLKPFHVYGRLDALNWEDSNGFKYGEADGRIIANLLITTYNKITKNLYGDFTNITNGWELYLEIIQQLKGSRPPQLRKDQSDILNFIFGSVDKIYTYTESVDTGAGSNDNGFDHLYFLGFAFHPLNIKKLQDYVPIDEKMVVFSSVFNMKAQEVKKVESEVITKLLKIKSGKKHRSNISAYFQEAKDLTIPEFFKTFEDVRYFS